MSPPAMGSGEGEVEGLVSRVFSLASSMQISHLPSVFFNKWYYLCQMYIIKVL